MPGAVTTSSAPTFDERAPRDRRRRVRLAVAADHPLLRIGIRSALADDGGFEIVAEARNGREVLPVLERAQADALLLDLALPGIGCFECVDRVRRRFGRRVRVVVLASESDPALIESVFRRGAAGYILKTIDVGDLGPAIREALDGTAFHAFGFPALAAGAEHATGLTRREVEVLRAVGRGLSNKAAARELFVTEQTIKYHLTNVYRKLGVANRLEAARWAIAHGLELG